MKTSIVFRLTFANNIISLCFFLSFLIIDFYLLIPAAITQMFHSTAKLAIPTGKPANEANGEFETHPLAAETKTRKCLN